MPFRPSSALLDPLSFAIGFLAGTLFWFLIGRIRVLWQEMRARSRQRREALEAQRARSVEARYRQNVLLRAQGMHLAAPLFALDEVYVWTRVLAPPIQPWPGEEMPPVDSVEANLPYLPWWPELGTTFGAPMLEPYHLLHSQVPIALLAPTGYGKTVALAHLASLMAKKDEDLGERSEALPILFHVSELELPLEENASPVDLILRTVQRQNPDLSAAELDKLLRVAIEQGQAVYLLDGYDELPPEGQQSVSQFLRALRRAAPKMLILTTASPEQMDGLLGLGFSLMALQAWDRRLCLQFLRRWGQAWEKEISKEVWGESPLPQIDPLLINLWLENELEGCSPLEITLKVWGAYAGDMTGLRMQDALLAHVRRLSPPDLPIAAAEMLAVQVITNLQPHFRMAEARQWLRQFEPSEPEVAAEQEEEKKFLRKKKTVAKPSSGAIGKFAESGLIRSLPQDRMAFLHPGLGYFLAARGLSAYGMEEALASQPEWSGKWGTITYLVGESENTTLSASLLREDKPPLHRLLFLLGRALRLAPPKSSWRKLLAQLGKIFQDESLPFSQRAEAMLALALSRDPGTATLFRHYLNSDSPQTLALAALGCGLTRDEKAVEPLLTLLFHRSEENVRVAVALALVAIGTSPALEGIARTLLQGDENARRIAAEALANDPMEGHATLRDGLTHEDILLRRAVIYGLARVQESWAETLLQRAQVEDDHWMVRNAAAGVLEQRANFTVRLPRPLRPPSETPWLLEFAGKQGMGIAPGSPAIDLLLQALRQGGAEEQFAALAYLKRTPVEGLFAALYPILYDPTSPLREAVYRTLWEIACAGEQLPHPQKYGLGA